MLVNTHQEDNQGPNTHWDKCRSHTDQLNDHTLQADNDMAEHSSTQNSQSHNL